MKKNLALLSLIGFISSAAYANPVKIGTIERGSNGAPLKLNFNEANDYCKEKGSRVPTLAEFLVANESGSLSSDPELKNYKYWTSTEAPESIIDRTIPVITVGIAETFPTVYFGQSGIHPVITFDFVTPEYLSVEWSHFNQNDWTVVRCIKP